LAVLNNDFPVQSVFIRNIEIGYQKLARELLDLFQISSHARRVSINLMFFLLAFSGLSQDIDHWESVVVEADTWRYLVPTSEPDASWTTAGFDDQGWTEGVSGFGYGDEDDNTLLPEGTLSVYLRRKFDIVDLSVIHEVLLNMDYDDAFVAYVNGVEVARGQISGDPPAFDQPSDGLHEALLYQGVPPEGFEVPISLLVEGENILTVQVHNQSMTSSDLSALPVLSVGVTTTDFTYSPTPTWFLEPLDFTTSNLPIVVIDTRGAAVPDEPKTIADLGVIDNASGENSVTDAYTYTGFCGIETRGASSQSFPKKNYGIEMWDEFGNDIDTTFVGFPAEEDFILHGPYSDKSLINNVLAMKLANDLGQYASRTRFVELVLNGDYRGVYVAMEKIKRDNERLDISRLREEDIEGDQLTGGYIIRIDRAQERGWASQYNAYQGGEPIFFEYYYPDENNIQPQQEAYIRSYVDEFESALFSNSRRNSKGFHYLDYMDLRTFVDNFILDELSKNVDAYRLSTYFYKDRSSDGGKLKAGPIWDYNLAFGNGDYCGGDDTQGWEFYQCVGSSPFWWDHLLQDQEFTNGLRCRWEELRGSVLQTQRINNYLDSLAVAIAEATDRNFQRWPVMGRYVWPNSWFYASANSHLQVIDRMKNWIEERSIWLDQNIPGVAANCELYEPPYLDLITSVEDEVESFEVRVYPNPARDQINVESTSIIDEIVITNTLGQVVGKVEPASRKTAISTDTFRSRGMVILTIITNNSIEYRKVRID